MPVYADKYAYKYVYVYTCNAHRCILVPTNSCMV